ncbi:hypothetical protein CSUB01_10532 [Colletotrichum sublineola]|uniref:Uncharacterized protein n=1 Tax=Colletotrichum sublineola TaxID=1173701 RepID=A0A066WYK4_COLSU|nr:hypothetical protein CSUB01_10532 [Colletotrichum sublineola]
MRTSRVIEILSCSTVARELTPRKPSKPLTLSYGYRIIATLVQATGVEHRPPCDRCARANGPWEQCVVLQSPEGIQTTKGGCANCWWNNAGSRCSHRTLPSLSCTTFINLTDASFARRSGVSIGTISQPPGTLADCFPGLNRWEMELETLGNPGITSRASTLARMNASELVAQYKDLISRLNAVHASIAHLTHESQQLGQQVSELSLILSFQRTFEVRRTAATISAAGSSSAPGFQSSTTGQDSTARDQTDIHPNQSTSHPPTRGG